MTIPTNLPYIDLGADADTLKKYAQDNFGKKISSLAKDETVVERFKAIYLEETGITLADVAPLDDDNDADDDTGDTTSSKENPASSKPQPIAATIIVQDDPADPGAICGGVNFVPYRIMRNVEARISIAQLTALKNAKKTTYDPNTMEAKEVLAYPFSIVEMHY